MTSVEFLDEIIHMKYSFKNRFNSLNQFLTYEFYFLTNHLSLNPQKFNKEAKLPFSSIENYFPYPMIFSKCLFNALDTNHQKFLKIEDYVNSFLTLYTGGLEDKIKFVWKMFNINNDSYVHIEDFRCVLRYTHIFYNKKNIELLNKIIDDFFGRKKVFNMDDFTKRTIRKNAGLFFVVLSVLFEHKTFDAFVLSVVDDPENPKISTTISPEQKSSMIKRAVSKFKMTSTNYLPIKKDSRVSVYFQKYNTNAVCSGNSNYNTNTASSTMKIPQTEVLDYIKINYGIELSIENTPSFMNVNDDSYHSESDDDENTIEDEDCRTMQDDLQNFEDDFINVKTSLLEQYFMLNEYRIPKGSNGVEFQSGDVSNLSSMFRNSAMSKRSFNLSILNTSSDDLRGTYKSLSSKKSSFTKRTHNSTTMLNKVKCESSRKFVTTFSDFAQSTMSINNAIDYYEEDVMIYTNNTIKKYIMIVIKGFMLILKKNKDDINSNCPVNAKRFIPLHKLYISHIDYHYKINDVSYCHLTLVSTVLYKRKTFTFLFDDKNRFVALVNLIIRLTNFVSISDEYTMVKDIGKGSFSQTKLMKNNSTGLLYAVKKLNKQTANVEEFTTQNWEKDIVTFLSNLPNIEHIFKCYRIIESLDHIYFITEYVQGGSLWNFIRRNKVCLQSTVVKKIIHQLSIGIKQLHYYGIVHRDLKFENVLMDYQDNEHFDTKIIDFGLSQVITPLSKTKETYGSLIFCSPEILLSIPYNVKVDVWSLGIMAYYLEYTYFPFGIKGNERDQETSNKIIMNELKFPKKIDSNNDQREFAAGVVLLNVIKICLTKDINQRPFIDQIEQGLAV